MTKLCRRCDGSGHFYSRKPVGPSALFTNEGVFTCKVCGGTGIDPNWLERTCRGCSGIIEYHINWTNIPVCCENCRKWQTKPCQNCFAEIRYKSYWTNVPDYCDSCRNNWQQKRCKRPGCERFVRYKAAWNDIPEYCSEKCQRMRQQPCKSCGSLFWYDPEWENIPNLCPDCNKWQEKPCKASGCQNLVRYKVGWSTPPDFCKSCNSNRKQEIDWREVDPDIIFITGGVPPRRTVKELKPDDTWRITHFWDNGQRISYDLEGANRKNQHGIESLLRKKHPYRRFSVGNDKPPSHK